MFDKENSLMPANFYRHHNDDVMFFITEHNYTTATGVSDTA